MLNLPRSWLRKILQKRDCLKPYLDYENNVRKYESSRRRINLLKTWNSTDIIPDFFKFRVPKTEIFTAADTHHKFDQKQALSRKVLLMILDNHLLPSIIFVLRNRVRNYVVSSEQRLQEKLAKLSKSR